MTKEFFVIKNGKGLIVQNWTFAPKAFISYCKSPEWAMKFETEAKANDRLDYFFKNKFTMLSLPIKCTKRVSSSCHHFCHEPHFSGSFSQSSLVFET